MIYLKKKKIKLNKNGMLYLKKNRKLLKKFNTRTMASFRKT